MKYNLPNKHTYSSGALQVRSESLLRSYYEVCCHYAKQLIAVCRKQSTQ